MTYHLSWLATGIVVVVSIGLGVVTSLVFTKDVPRVIWALLVALVFIGAGIASILFDYSWMASSMQRLVAQALAIGAFLTGITYAMRDKA